MTKRPRFTTAHRAVIEELVRTYSAKTVIAATKRAAARAARGQGRPDERANLAGVWAFIEVRRRPLGCYRKTSVRAASKQLEASLAKMNVRSGWSWQRLRAMHSEAEALRESNADYRALCEDLLADYAGDTPDATRIPVLGKRRPDGDLDVFIDSAAVGVSDIEIRKSGS